MPFDIWAQSTLDKAESVVKIVGAPVAAFWALLQWRASIRQRHSELAWKQAEQGKKIFDQIFEDRESNAALFMIDSPPRAYTTLPGETLRITPADVILALSGDNDAPASLFIRDCFDKLFYYFDRARQFELSDLVRRATLKCRCRTTLEL
jgi:hypothetical protein